MDPQPQKSEKKLKDKPISVKKQPNPTQKSKIPENSEDLSPTSHINPKPINDVKISPPDQQNSLNMSFESNNLNNPPSENNTNTTATGIGSTKASKTQNLANDQRKSGPPTIKTVALNLTNSSNSKNLKTPKNNKTVNSNNNKEKSAGAKNTSSIIQKSHAKTDSRENNVVEFYKKQRGYFLFPLN